MSSTHTYTKYVIYQGAKNCLRLATIFDTGNYFYQLDIEELVSYLCGAKTLYSNLQTFLNDTETHIHIHYSDKQFHQNFDDINEHVLDII